MGSLDGSETCLWCFYSGALQKQRSAALSWPVSPAVDSFAWSKADVCMPVNQTWWNQMQKTPKKTSKNTNNCCRVDNESEGNVLISAAALCAYVGEWDEVRRWGDGSERKRYAIFCPLGCGSNDAPSTPLPSTPFQAPSSLLEALEQHLASLEGRKLKDLSAASRYQLTTNKLPATCYYYWLLLVQQQVISPSVGYFGQTTIFYYKTIVFRHRDAWS